MPSSQPGADRSRVHKGNKSVCNPAKVEDHHAILPTPKKPGSLSADEKKIYDLIARRFLSHYYGPAVYLNHTVIRDVESEKFRTRVKQLLEKGWKVTQGDGGEGDARTGQGQGQKGRKSDEDEQELTEQSFEVNPKLPVVCKQAKARRKRLSLPKPTPRARC